MVGDSRNRHLQHMETIVQKARMALAWEFSGRTGVPHSDAVNNHLSLAGGLRLHDVYEADTGEYKIPSYLIRDEPVDFDVIRRHLVAPVEAQIACVVRTEYQIWRWYCDQKEEIRRTISKGLTPRRPHLPDLLTVLNWGTSEHGDENVPLAIGQTTTVTPLSPVVRKIYRRKISELRKAVEYIHTEVETLIAKKHVSPATANMALQKVYAEFRRSKRDMLRTILITIFWRGVNPPMQDENDFSWQYATASLFVQTCIMHYLTPQSIFITPKPGSY